MKGTPPSLYATSVNRVASHFDRFATLDLSRHLTEAMRFDVYWELVMPLFILKKFYVANAFISPFITQTMHIK
jgi:hypothetical protein